MKVAERQYSCLECWLGGIRPEKVLLHEQLREAYFCRRANLPAFGGIIPLSRRIPAIPRGIHEIPLF